jgi:hypothetical protein
VQAPHDRIRHTALTVRDGRPVAVDVTELVPGDLARLVSADRRREHAIRATPGQGPPVPNIAGPVALSVAKQKVSAHRPVGQVWTGWSPAPYSR